MHKFDIFITPRSGDEYNVQVVDSPAGGPTEAASVTINKADPLVAPVMAQMVERQRVRPRESLQVLGEWLADRLLPAGDVRTLYQRSLGRVGSESLTIRLSVPDSLIEVPWEYTWDPTARDFLLLNQQVLLVRRPVEMGLARDIAAVEGPLRMLLAIADIDDPNIARLDVVGELEGLHRAVQDLLEEDELSIDILFGGRDEARAEIEARAAGWEGVALLDTPLAPDELIFALQRGVHIWHYIGHGQSDPKKGGQLLLTDKYGDMYPFGAENLRTVLAGGDSLGLVYLNACETAMPNTGRDLLSMADALVRAQVPAVVAMQYKVPDMAAANFARAFYQAVAGGEPLHLALARGRQAVRAIARRLDIDWGIPVLYLRTQDGLVWGKEAEPLGEEIHVHDGDYVRGDKSESTATASDHSVAMTGSEINLGEGSSFVLGDNVRRGDDIMIQDSTIGGASVVGSGSTRADTVVGGDLVGGADTLKARGVAKEDMDALREEIGYLREDASELGDRRKIERALDLVEDLEEALGLTGGTVRLRRFRRRAERLTKKVPELSDSVSGFVEVVDEIFE